MYVECVEDGSKNESSKRASSGPLGAGWIAAASVALLLALPGVSGALETATLSLNPPAAEEGPKVRRLEASRGSGTVTLPDTLEEDATSVLSMEFGKSLMLRAPARVKRVSVGDANALDVVVLGAREVQLVPRAMGSTNVVIWGDSGQVLAALDVEIGAPYSQLERQLRDTLGTSEIEVHGAGEAIVLKGDVSDAVTAEQALKLAHAFVGEKGEDRVVNLIGVGGRQQVMLKVVIAEMSRQVTRDFGTNFAASITGNNGNVGIASFLRGLSPSIDPGELLVSDVAQLALGFTGFGSLEFLAVFIDALDERGLAKILAQPTLVARSGETASFLVGGEVPIPVTQSGSFAGAITIEYKDFGVGLGFTPTVLADDRIHLTVSPEVSQADFSTQVQVVEGNVIPSFRTRRASTSVELADGQSLAIAGLLSEDVIELVSQYPILGSVPILGTIFRSSSFLKNETELMIIVTPKLVKALDEGPHPLPVDGFVEPNMFEFWMLGKMEGRPRKTSGGMVGDVGHRVSDSPYWSEK
jgi:pilus assembly protein CpaC